LHDSVWQRRDNKPGLIRQPALVSARQAILRGMDCDAIRTSIRLGQSVLKLIRAGTGGHPQLMFCRKIRPVSQMELRFRDLSNETPLGRSNVATTHLCHCRKRLLYFVSVTLENSEAFSTTTLFE
jgi:hypothetical protein